MVKENYDAAWTDPEKDLLHWRHAHPDQIGSYRDSRMKIRIDLTEGAHAEIKDDDGVAYLEIPFETTVICQMFVPDTFSNGKGRGPGRTHIVFFGLEDDGTWSEKPRDDESFTKKNVARLHRSEWNHMEELRFDDVTLHLERNKQYRLWPKRIGFWTNLENDQFDPPAIQGQNRFKIPMLFQLGEQEPQEITHFVLT
jgi:hypothetical protein